MHASSRKIFRYVDHASSGMGRRCIFRHKGIEHPYSGILTSVWLQCFDNVYDLFLFCYRKDIEGSLRWLKPERRWTHRLLTRWTLETDNGRWRCGHLPAPVSERREVESMVCDGWRNLSHRNLGAVRPIVLRASCPADGPTSDSDRLNCPTHLRGAARRCVRTKNRRPNPGRIGTAVPPARSTRPLRAWRTIPAKTYGNPALPAKSSCGNSPHRAYRSPHTGPLCPKASPLRDPSS